MTRALTFDVRHRHKLGKKQDLTLSLLKLAIESDLTVVYGELA